jgi:hypothetical protein
VTAAEEEIMTLSKDVSQAPTEATAEPVQDLAEFEPDPAGDGDTAPRAVGTPADDPQWIVWADPSEEAVWAEVELVQIGARSGL